MTQINARTRTEPDVLQKGVPHTLSLGESIEFTDSSWDRRGDSCMVHGPATVTLKETGCPHCLAVFEVDGGEIVY